MSGERNEKGENTLNQCEKGQQTNETKENSRQTQIYFQNNEVIHSARTKYTQVKKW